MWNGSVGNRSFVDVIPSVDVKCVGDAVVNSVDDAVVVVLHMQPSLQGAVMPMEALHLDFDSPVVATMVR